jgi:2-hydroxy-3-keto-5-methylthiopentenyl-1-phosphate phosphatase
VGDTGDFIGTITMNDIQRSILNVYSEEEK